MKILLIALTSLALGCGGKPSSSTTPAPAAAKYESPQEAARALLELIEMDKLLGQSIEQMLDLQIQQNPSIGHLKPVMLKFMNKYMSWEALADDMIAMYVDVYEQAELEELIVFYSTPTGTKSVKLMPELMKRGSELGSARVQEHITELQQMIMDELKGQEERPMPATPASDIPVQ